uniref:P-type domain-containing protein n=1 Tax=Meloidogyne floridensis TaxID=298350 RepID=A0A915P813_9BILA
MLTNNLLNKLIFYILFSLINLISSTSIAPNFRIDCTPIPGENKSKCLERGCIWDDNYDKYHSSVPLCYFPPKTGYRIQKRLTKNKLLLERIKGAKNPYGEDFKLLEFEVEEISSALHLKIGHDKRFIPPIELNLNSKIETLQEDKLNIEILPQFKQKLNGLGDSDEFFSFNIVRNKTKIWDTSIGGLLFADQYIQIATCLHDFSKYTTWGMLGRDQPPDYNNPNSANLYGVHPFYIGLEPNGKAHGVLILNSNAQEITTGPGPHLIYRTIGGRLDILFLPGPTPEQVIQQFQQIGI